MKKLFFTPTRANNELLQARVAERGMNMKIIYNANEYGLERFAADRDETEKLLRMGAINYINYLRVYKNMDIWPCDD